MLKVQTAIEKATIYDGIGDKPLSEATILISGDTIAYAGPHRQAPSYEAEEIYAAEGLFVLPGLIDLHVHGLVDQDSLLSFLQTGVTTIRDLACDVFEALEWKAKERSGLIDSPRIYTAGPVLTCPGGYPQNVWGPKIAAPVQGRYQAQEKVRKLCGLGMDVIKIGLEHELGPCLSEAEVEGIVKAAHALGKRVTAHITNEADFELCLKFNVDEMAHMPSRPLSDDLWKEAARKGVLILPTLHAHAGWAEEWRRRSEHPFGQFCHLGFKAGHDQSRKNLGKFLTLGGQVAYGTDAGNPHMPYGVSVKEWSDLQISGLSSLQCLKMATSDAAKILGLEDRLGSIVKGKWADLVILRNDPLRHPENFRTIQRVYKAGKAYPGGGLDFPKPFDLDYWIRQWEKTKFKPGWEGKSGGK